MSLLCLSPSVLMPRVSHGRAVASTHEEIKGRPRFEKLVEKINSQDTVGEISSDDHKDKLGGLKLKLLQEREQFRKNISDEALVLEQRKIIENLVAEALLIEGSLKSLVDKKEVQEEDAKTRGEVLSESKDIIEGLLTDLEFNEILVAKVKGPAVEDKPVEPQKPVVVDKPVEPQKPVVAEKPKEEPKKEEQKICESDEKNKLLSNQVEELLKQQNQILQTMVGMAQMMVSMHQRQPQNPYFQNGPGWNQSPYQYQQPFTSGNWVYYPSGFQPQQLNIFQQPNIYHYQIPQRGGIYPDQIYGQPQSPQPQYQKPEVIPSPLQHNWAIQPNPNLSIQANTVPVSYGQSLNGGLGFNMSQTPVTSFIP